MLERAYAQTNERTHETFGLGLKTSPGPYTASATKLQDHVLAGLLRCVACPATAQVDANYECAGAETCFHLSLEAMDNPRGY